MLCIKIEFTIEKSISENKFPAKTIFNPHMYINADYKNYSLSRLRLYFTAAGTHLQC